MKKLASQQCIIDALDNARVANSLRDPSDETKDDIGLGAARKFAEIILEGILNEHNVDTENLNPVRKIDICYEQQWLSEAEKSDFHDIRLAGNKGIHEKVYVRTRQKGWAAFDRLSIQVRGWLATERASPTPPPPRPSPPPPPPPRPSPPPPPPPRPDYSGCIFSVVAALALVLLLPSLLEKYSKNDGDVDTSATGRDVVLSGSSQLMKTIKEMNIRSHPSKRQGRIIAKVRANEIFDGLVVQGIGSSERWARVTLKSGQIGYIWMGGVAIGPSTSTASPAQDYSDYPRPEPPQQRNTQPDTSYGRTTKPDMPKVEAKKPQVKCLFPRYDGSPPQEAYRTADQCVEQGGTIE